MNKTLSIAAALISIACVSASAEAAVKKQISNVGNLPCSTACRNYADNHGIAGSLQSSATYPSGVCDCVWALAVPAPGTYDDFFGCWADTRFGDLVDEDVRATCFEPVYGDAAMSASMASSIDSLVDKASDDVQSLFSSYGARFKRQIVATGGTAGKKIADGWSAFYPCWATLEVSAPDTSLYGGCWESVYGDLKIPSASQAGVTEIAVELVGELDQLRGEYQSAFEPIFSKLPTL